VIPDPSGVPSSPTGDARPAGVTAVGAAPGTNLLPGCARILCLGIGGGGDVVGALGAARLLGRPFVVGGLTWERLPVDPVPGPRRLDEIVDHDVLSPTVARADGRTRTTGGIGFAESRMSDVLGAPTVLVDPNPGPAAVADGIRDALGPLGCDGVLLVDVGGDVLAHGDEAGLASPLADALLLAAGLRLVHAGVPTALGIVGAGCDGELTPDEVAARVAEIDDRSGVLADLPLDPEGLDDALAHVVTEASAMAARCARGERGPATIRDGRRSVELTALGGRVLVLDVEAAIAGPARLARLLADATDLEDGEARLAAIGIRSELAWERERTATAG